MMRNLLQNLRFSLRMLGKNLGFTATVVLTLALGIGTTTAIYTVVYATLIADMPYPKPEELVVVWSMIHGHRALTSAGDYMDWLQRTDIFQALHASQGGNGTMNLGGIQESEMVPVAVSTPGMYTERGIHFLYGRDFLPEETIAGKNQVVILSNHLWKRLGGDPKILGKTIQLNQRPYTVVGVLDSGQSDNYPWDLMIPLVIPPAAMNRDARWLGVNGRLKDGVTLQQANAAMATVAATLAKEYPRTHSGMTISVESMKDDWLSDEFKRTLWLFLGASGFVLLIACVNVANLLLARGTTRQKEVAVRSALGASRRSVFAQFIVESLVLAAVGGALGIGVGYALVRGFKAVLPFNTLPGEAIVQLSVPVLLVTLAATALAGLLFGCAPAWYASRVDPAEFLKEGGRAGSSRLRNRLRNLLVVGEFALALTLLGGAGMAIHSLWNLYHIDLGVDTRNVLTFILPTNRGTTAADQSIGYYRQVSQRIASVPGVLGVSVSTGLPLEGSFFRLPFSMTGLPESADPMQRPMIGLSSVTPEYFRTFGIRLLQGRFFTESDNATGLHVAVVNEFFVRHYMPSRNPIGQTINIPLMTPGTTPAMLRTIPLQPWVIVGVFHDVHGGMFQPPSEEVDVPFYQDPYPVAAVAVRTAGNPEANRESISAAVHAIDPTVALTQVFTLDEIRDRELTGQRFNLFLYICFAILALVLAAVGTYGVMAFSVGQRQHEIGIRMALGADRSSVVRMILREGTVFAIVGSLLGLVGAYIVGQAIRTTLYGISAFDFTAFGAVVALLLITAWIASYFPARRAASVDPMAALREE